MADLSLNKGSAVSGIQGTSQQPGGLARPQVSPPPKDGGGRRQRGGEDEEAKAVLVEIGEEARQSLEQAEGEAAPEEAETKEGEAQGGIVDVVV